MAGKDESKPRRPRDPTDDVLATIARIKDRKDASSSAERTADQSAAGPKGIRPPHAEPEEAAPEGASAHSSVSSPHLRTEPEFLPELTPEPAPEPPPPPPKPHLADTYMRAGPGPLDAIRFRWRSRRDGDVYFVEETIGEQSRTLTSGPMSADEAVAFIDKAVEAAQNRYEALRAGMAGGSKS